MLDAKGCTSQREAAHDGCVFSCIGRDKNASGPPPFFPARSPCDSAANCKRRLTVGVIFEPSAIIAVTDGQRSACPMAQNFSASDSGSRNSTLVSGLGVIAAARS